MKTHFVLLLLVLVGANFVLMKSTDEEDDRCDSCDDEGGEDLDPEQMAALEAQMLETIEKSIPPEAKAAIGRRDLLWFGLGAVNFELIPREQQLEEMVQASAEEEVEEEEGSESNDGPVSKAHSSWIILFGLSIIALLILVGSFMVANAYFSRVALQNRARAAEKRMMQGGGSTGGGSRTHREQSSFFRAPNSVTFSTD